MTKVRFLSRLLWRRYAAPKMSDALHHANQGTGLDTLLCLRGVVDPVDEIKNVFEAILKYGHDEDFAPNVDVDFVGTTCPAGSREKLDVLAERVRRGQPLWHPDDRQDYSGLTGAVRPRE